jgi:hypothetical protein
LAVIDERYEGFDFAHSLTAVHQEILNALATLYDFALVVIRSLFVMAESATATWHLLSVIPGPCRFVAVPDDLSNLTPVDSDADANLVAWQQQAEIGTEQVTEAVES